MQVTIIGSGNVATVMGRLLLLNGHQIKEVYSRNVAHAAELAEQLLAKTVSDIGLLNEDADLYLIAVSDDALVSITEKMFLKNKLVLHTSGSVSKEILKNVSTDYGVIWPMKMIRKTMVSLSSATMVIDGSSEMVMEQIKQLAHQFSPLVTIANDSLRLKMHMLATLTSNFANHLYHLAELYCLQEKIDFGLFYAIIEETAKQIQNNQPKLVQAGPALRGDYLTIEKHRQLLEQYPQMQKLYLDMSKSIQISFGGKPETEDNWV